MDSTIRAAWKNWREPGQYINHHAECACERGAKWVAGNFNNGIPHGTHTHTQNKKINVRDTQHIYYSIHTRVCVCVRNVCQAFTNISMPRTCVPSTKHPCSIYICISIHIHTCTSTHSNHNINLVAHLCRQLSALASQKPLRGALKTNRKSLRHIRSNEGQWLHGMHMFFFA